MGSPAALQIISSAVFKGYHKEVYDYVLELRDASRVKRVAQGRVAHLESIIKENQPGSKRGKAIDIDDSGREDGTDSGVEILGGTLTGQSAESGNFADDNEEFRLQSAAVEAVMEPDSRHTSHGVNHRESADGMASTSIAAPGTTATATIAVPEGAPKLRLSLRGGRDSMFGVLVPSDKTALSLIKHYLKKAGLPTSKAEGAKLLFDGEAIDHHLTMDEVGVEDEDTLDIQIPAA